MPVTAESIESRLRAAFPQAMVRIEDLRGDGDHYALHIETPEFAGKTRVQQHQMIYAALGGMMNNALHALAITTAVPQN